MKPQTKNFRKNPELAEANSSISVRDSTDSAVTGSGIPFAATDFYAELELHNNRQWWLTNKERYKNTVKAPMAAVLERLEPNFGPTKFFRPYRDQRFATEASPYKTAQSAFLSNHEEVGYYVQISADGVMISGGYRSASPSQLRRFRAAIDAPTSGTELTKIISDLERQGFQLDGDKLKSVPRGFNQDHPRAALLKFKTIQAFLRLGKPQWLPTPKCADHLQKRCEQLRPLIDWVIRYAAP